MTLTNFCGRQPMPRPRRSLAATLCPPSLLLLLLFSCRCVRPVAVPSCPLACGLIIFSLRSGRTTARVPAQRACKAGFSCMALRNRHTPSGSRVAVSSPTFTRPHHEGFTVIVTRTAIVVSLLPNGMPCGRASCGRAHLSRFPSHARRAPPITLPYTTHHFTIHHSNEYLNVVIRIYSLITLYARVRLGCEGGAQLGGGGARRAQSAQAAAARCRRRLGGGSPSDESPSGGNVGAGGGAAPSCPRGGAPAAPAAAPPAAQQRRAGAAQRINA